MIRLMEESNGQVVATQICGMLDKEDYKEIFPMVTDTIEKNGTLRWYIQLCDFESLDLYGMWKEIKLGVEHFSDIEKIAIVGERELKELIMQSLKYISGGNIRYFSNEEKELAKDWLEQ